MSIRNHGTAAKIVRCLSARLKSWGWKKALIPLGTGPRRTESSGVITTGTPASRSAITLASSWRPFRASHLGLSGTPRRRKMMIIAAIAQRTEQAGPEYRSDDRRRRDEPHLRGRGVKVLLD